MVRSLVRGVSQVETVDQTPMLGVLELAVIGIMDERDESGDVRYCRASRRDRERLRQGEGQYKLCY